MGIHEIILLISSISKGVIDLKKAYSAVPRPIFLPPAKKKLTEVQNKINSIEEKISKLEGKIKISFPELARLVRSYAQLISDVRIAGALSDKAAELYGIAPDSASTFTTMFANDIQSEYSRISSSISQLPSLDVSEQGQLQAKLSIIRDLVRDMKNADQDDVKNIKRILDSISTQYSDIESILSELLERILVSLELSQR
ncbi:MAG: hypothetical protein F6K21_03035 [Symploca sp. SIO2D2]|nr:hypothetical protein [Symploca sp. SIO2D2]